MALAMPAHFYIHIHAIVQQNLDDLGATVRTGERKTVEQLRLRCIGLQLPIGREEISYTVGAPESSRGGKIEHCALGRQVCRSVRLTVRETRTYERIAAPAQS